MHPDKRRKIEQCHPKASPIPHEGLSV